MHVHHSVYIQRPVQEVSSALLESPHKLLPRSVGLHVAGIPFRKRIHILVGEPESTST